MDKKTGCTPAEIVLIGDILVDNICWVDRLPDSGSDVAITRYARQSGGSAANSCCVLADLGAHCSFCGLIGRDSTGRELEERLAAKNIDIDCLIRSDSKTGFTYTMVEPGGERTMLSYRDSSSAGLKLTDELSAAIKAARVLYLSGYLLSVKEQAEFAFDAARLARSAGTVVMLDTSPIIGSVDKSTIDTMLSLTDVLMPNRRELSELSGTDDLEKSIEIIHEKLPAMVIKMGGEGSCLALRSGCTVPGMESAECVSIKVAARPVKPVDTTGAGDSFNAGFLASYLKNESPIRWLESGNAIAAEVISGTRERSIML